MDFGMPTLIEIESLSETVNLCLDLGLDFIELNMNMPQYQTGRLAVETILQHQKKSIYYTLHLDENLNIWDFNPLVANAYLETVMSAICIARKAKIPVLNMHMNYGVHFTLPDKKVFLFEQYRERYLEQTYLFRQQCETAIGQYDIKICIENSSGFNDFQIDAIQCLLESNVFGLTMDIGHNYVTGNVDEPFILQHQDKLCHMHIHDAAGQKDHLAIGTGEIHIPEKLRLANTHHCRCVLETKTIDGLTHSVQNLRKFYSD